MSPVFFLAWGIWFVLFDATGSSISYEKAKFFSNFEWSLVFTMVGLLRMLAIIKGSKRLRFWSILCAASLWFAFFVIFAMSNLYSHAVPTTFLFSLLNLLTIREVSHKE